MTIPNGEQWAAAFVATEPAWMRSSGRTMAHFSPWVAARPCWWCRWYDGMDSSGSAALCSLQGACRVRSMPANGCSAFEREPGCDDEPDWSPLETVAAPYR